MTKECTLYSSLKDQQVQCQACAHRCLIAPGKSGICGVRRNMNGKLFLTVFGKVVAKNDDPVEKKPLYHFLPGTKAYSIGTVGCNFACSFCQNYDISQLEEAYGETVSPLTVVRQAKKLNCQSIAYTYNEPTIFIEFAIAVAKEAKKAGLKNILVTNGYMTKECFSAFTPFIDAMNIDLKSMQEAFYLKHCKANLAPVLQSIQLAHKKKIWLEVTTLLIPHENDSDLELSKIASFISGIDPNIPWHVSRFFPMFKMTDRYPTEEKHLLHAQALGEKVLRYVYTGNLSGEHNSFCPACHHEIIHRTGYQTDSFLKSGKCPSCHTKITGVWK